MVAAPLGQSLPSVWGVSGCPSMSMIVSPFEYTSWLQPTEQYGQTLVWTLASLSLIVVAAAATGLRSSVAVPMATPPPVLERLDDGPLMGDFHDGPTQDRVVVPAEFAKNAADFGQIVEAFLEPLDQLQRVVFALPRLEAA